MSLQSFSQLFLRVAIGTAYFVYGSDRLGLWGAPGEENVSWGDWQHFMAYAENVMSFLPRSIVPALAALATLAEISIGILLVAGLKVRYTAFASGVLAFLFATSMAISFGLLSPLGYGVFTLSAASFLLSSIPEYKYAVDGWLTKH